jgi:hypothetical protein
MDQYAAMEAVILSDQVSSAQLAALLRDDPTFEDWIRARGTARHGASVSSQNGRTESPDQLVTTTEA